MDLREPSVPQTEQIVRHARLCPPPLRISRAVFARK
jgi:hypothetical protein